MSTNENNTVAPQGQMEESSFTEPNVGSSRTKLTNINLIPQGYHIAHICAVVDLGTHSESYQGKPPTDKRKLQILLEFPQFKQRFYEEDTEVRSTMLFAEMTFYTGSQANLRSILEAFSGGPLSDKEAKSFPVGRILGSNIGVVITHKAKKNGDLTEKITSYSAVGSTPLPQNFHPELDKHKFYIDKDGKNFLTKNYADLPYFLKKKILASKEAISYAQRGGKFAENPKTDDQNVRQANPQDRAQPSQFAQSNDKEVIMIDTEYTLDQYLASNWTLEQLVQAGKAKWKSSPQPPAPSAPSAPAGPPAPSSFQQPNSNGAFNQGAQQNQLSNNGFGNDDEDDLPF